MKTKLIRHLFSKAVCVLFGALVAALGLYLYQALAGPPLTPWHTWKPIAEFHTRAQDIHDFATYLELEKQLFDELNTFRQRVEVPRISRYSPHNPLAHPVDGLAWNRTIELKTHPVSRAVLLLHGMSDSPYSLRSLALTFQRRGFHVLALRLPGHGTIPSSLTRFSWQDMAKAVRLAVSHQGTSLQRGQPLFVVGYSNGAALALDYALTSLVDDQLERPDGLILISPAIAVTPAARFSRLIIAAGHLPGLHELEWLSRQPEYDPYKYNSFPVNAGYQVYLLSTEVRQRLNTWRQQAGMGSFPPVLAIQSVVDTTVSASAVADQLMATLRSGKDELILFDVNRDADIVSLFVRTGRDELNALMTEPTGYALTLVSNRDPDSPEVLALNRPAGSAQLSSTLLGLQWPRGIYSLSHVALPIPPDDPIYGVGRADEPTLGRIELRGEQKLLLVPADQLMRLRYNPFYDYMESRILEFTQKCTVATKAYP